MAKTIGWVEKEVKVQEPKKEATPVAKETPKKKTTKK